ncbi:hypothetical protein [Streptomyces nondiastaticus]|uniref:Transcriptional regulator n=1 Tax=Streptomyces nondiastaticus TaxID=3154512 RepID=A0ABW6TWT9_9ACTN
MSGPNAKAKLARLCSSLTGWKRSDCARWAEERCISKRLPVPDAVRPRQIRLESRILQTVANAFQDRQLMTEARDLRMPGRPGETLRLPIGVGAVYGVLRARPAVDGLTLHLHPRMTAAWLAEVLPHSDGAGGVLGVEGLRPRPSAFGTELVDLADGGRVILQGIDHASITSMMPDWQRGTSAFWRASPRSLTAAEREWMRWDTEVAARWRSFRLATDILNSRLIRRPGLVNSVAVHGLVNTYRSLNGNMVFEWCCGISKEAFEGNLRRSGLWAPPPWPLPDAEPQDAAPSPADARVTLRWSPECFMPARRFPDLQERVAAAYAGDYGSAS